MDRLSADDRNDQRMIKGWERMTKGCLEDSRG